MNTMSYNESILLFDEKGFFLNSLSVLLHTNGFKRVFSMRDSARIDSFLAGTHVSVLVYGLSNTTVAGKENLFRIFREHPNTKVIVVSTVDDRETAIECMQMGALDYLVHPIDTNRIQRNIVNCIGKPFVHEPAPPLMNTQSLNIPGIQDVFEPIVTRDRKMHSIFRYIEAIGPTSQTVMITGETGTGKELIARALHEMSGRTGSFVTVNVAGLDDIMFSDTLFGHARGAFTGADRERKGLIEKAAGGTLFLDEIGDLSSGSQVKLLRLLQNGEYYPLGSDNVVTTTARILVATNCVLEKKMTGDTFRKDLYYRLCSHCIHLPALRERSNDILLLVDRFSREAAKYLGRPIPTVSADMLDTLIQHDFPGNVRESKGLISNAVALSTSGKLSFPKLKPQSAASQPVSTVVDYSTLSQPSGRMPTLKEAEEYLIKEALRVSGGTQRTAAVLLGVSRQALNKRLLRDPAIGECK